MRRTSRYFGVMTTYKIKCICWLLLISMLKLSQAEDSTTVTISFGRRMNPDDIKEGDDVYFVCKINSSSPITKVAWKHNNVYLHHDLSRGILTSNQTLVLQKLEIEQMGEYTCEVTNTVSTSDSQPVILDMKFAPVCTNPEMSTHRVDHGETVRLNCSLKSNPEPAEFFWSFENSDQSIDIPETQYDNDRYYSILTYKPSSESDYGTVKCLSKSISGRQRHPCLFEILPPESNTIQFTTQNGTTVRAATGSRVLLPCQISGNTDKYTVAWIRNRDYHILTVGLYTYVPDQRFQSLHERDENSWNLMIRNLQPEDSGLYECQLSTTPPTSVFINLQVGTPKSTIKVEVVKRVEVGDTVELTCDIDTPGGVPPVYVFWYLEGVLLNYSSDTNIQIDYQGNTSKLSILEAKAEHSGNYTCSASNTPSSSVVVRVG